MAILAKRRPVNTWRADTDPAVTDDFDAGYVAGDTWHNVDTEAFFWLADDTVGAAVWVELSGGGGGQAADDDLDELSALTGTGIAVRTATTPTWATRTLVEGVGIEITNPAGIAGDITISAPNTLYTRVSKTTDTSRNSTITMTDDPHLVVSLPDGIWAFRCEVFCYGDANADWRLAMETSNAGAVLQWHWNLGNVFNCLLRANTGLNCSLSGTAGSTPPDNTRIMQLGGKVQVSGGPFDLSFEWAQFTSTAVDVTVMAGSWLEVWEVAV